MGTVVFLDFGFRRDFDQEVDVARVYRLPEDPGQEAVGEAKTAHPSQVVGAQIRLRDDPERLAEEGQRPRIALSLRNGDQVERRSDPLDDAQRRVTTAVCPVEVPAHGVACPAGELHNGDLVQGSSSIAPFAEPVENFVRESIPGARSYHVVCLDVDCFGNLHGVSLVLCPLDVDLATSSGEDGFDVPGIVLLSGALPSERVDQDFDPLLPLRVTVCAVQEPCDPGDSVPLRRLFDNVMERGGADYRFGGDLGILDGEI